MTKCRFYILGLPHFTLIKDRRSLVEKGKELSILDALSCHLVDHPTPEDGLLSGALHSELWPYLLLNVLSEHHRAVNQ